MLRAIARIHAMLKDTRTPRWLIACVHDELLLEVHDGDAEIARELTMIDSFAETFSDTQVDSVATPKIGQTWAEWS
jgi:DNA polymerase I-like protein with 3'-5' exonuclease and polymerase domains